MKLLLDEQISGKVAREFTRLTKALVKQPLPPGGNFIVWLQEP